MHPGGSRDLQELQVSVSPERGSGASHPSWNPRSFLESSVDFSPRPGPGWCSCHHKGFWERTARTGGSVWRGSLSREAWEGPFLRTGSRSAPHRGREESCPAGWEAKTLSLFFGVLRFPSTSPRVHPLTFPISEFRSESGPQVKCVPSELTIAGSQLVIFNKNMA